MDAAAAQVTLFKAIRSGGDGRYHRCFRAAVCRDNTEKNELACFYCAPPRLNTITDKLLVAIKMAAWGQPGVSLLTRRAPPCSFVPFPSAVMLLQ